MKDIEVNYLLCCGNFEVSKFMIYPQFLQVYRL